MCIIFPVAQNVLCCKFFYMNRSLYHQARLICKVKVVELCTKDRCENVIIGQAFEKENKTEEAHHIDQIKF